MSGIGHRWRLGYLPDDGSATRDADESKPLLQPMELPEIPSRPTGPKAHANQYVKLILCKPPARFHLSFLHEYMRYLH